jgi:hypothetical protein
MLGEKEVIARDGPREDWDAPTPVMGDEAECDGGDDHGDGGEEGDDIDRRCQPGWWALGSPRPKRPGRWSSSLPESSKAGR